MIKIFKTEVSRHDSLENHTNSCLLVCVLAVISQPSNL